jgi:hypothetical protein
MTQRPLKPGDQVRARYQFEGARDVVMTVLSVCGKEAACHWYEPNPHWEAMRRVFRVSSLEKVER